MLDDAAARAALVSELRQVAGDTEAAQRAAAGGVGSRNTPRIRDDSSRRQRHFTN
jgi:hypothetical protein